MLVTNPQVAAATFYRDERTRGQRMRLNIYNKYTTENIISLEHRENEDVVIKKNNESFHFKDGKCSYMSAAVNNIFFVLKVDLYRRGK